MNSGGKTHMARLFTLFVEGMEAPETQEALRLLQGVECTPFVNDVRRWRGHDFPVLPYLFSPHGYWQGIKAIARYVNNPLFKKDFEMIRQSDHRKESVTIYERTYPYPG